MKLMFQCCYKLTSLNVTNFDTSKVTNFQEMFKNSSNLKEIKVSSKWVISSSATITDMFTNCGVSSVTTV